MNEVQLDEQISKLLKDAREMAGVSQDFIAKELGVSKKTVQNWECGYSSPSVKYFVAWFNAIDIPIYPFIFRISHPEFDTINADSSDDEVRNALISVLKEMDITKIRKDFFEMFGNHGTSPYGMGEVKTAYLHLPIDVKVGIAEIICTQFEICKVQNRLVKPDHIMPNIENLKKYIRAAKDAIIKGKTTYTI